MTDSGLDRFKGMSFDVEMGSPELIARVQDSDIQSLAEAYAHSVYNEWIVRDGEEKVLEFTRARVVKKLQNPNTLCVFDAGRLIAFAGWTLVKMLPVGEEIVELSMNTVSRDYQGRGIGKALSRAREDMILGQYPNVHFSIVSKNPAIIKNAQNNAYEELSLEQYFKRIGLDGRYAIQPGAKERSVDPDLVMEGFVALIKNPREVEGSLGSFGSDLMEVIEVQSQEQGT